MRAGAVLQETMDCEQSMDGDCLEAAEGDSDTLEWPAGLDVNGTLADTLKSYQLVYQPAMSMYDRWAGAE